MIIDGDGKMKVSDFLDAMEKNGLKQAFNYFFRAGNGAVLDMYIGPNSPKWPKIKAACALGQAAYNLNMSPGELVDRLLGAGIDRAYIYKLNDKYHLSVPEIARKLRESYSPELLDTEI